MRGRRVKMEEEYDHEKDLYTFVTISHMMASG